MYGRCTFIVCVCLSCSPLDTSGTEENLNHLSTPNVQHYTCLQQAFNNYSLNNFFFYRLIRNQDTVVSGSSPLHPVGKPKNLESLLTLLFTHTPHLTHEQVMFVLPSKHIPKFMTSLHFHYVLSHPRYPFSPELL